PRPHRGGRWRRAARAAGARHRRSRVDRAARGSRARVVSEGSSFHVAFRILPPERRRAIEAVYGFCRRADDAVDEAPDPATARSNLARASAEVDALFANEPRADLDELRFAVER